MTLTPLTTVIDTVCRRVMPSWPLDRAIAVNPYAGLCDMPIEAAARHLAHVSGSPMLMPATWYEAQWQAGRIAPDIADAQARAHGWPDARTLLQAAKAPSRSAPLAVPLVTDVLDAVRQLERTLSCRHIVTHAISQHCAAYFDQGQARWAPPDRTDDGGLYAHWRAHAAADKGPALLSGMGGLHHAIGQLPDTPQALIEAALRAMRLPSSAWADYLGALLASVQGWASWCAYLDAQAPHAAQQPADHPVLHHLLAIRLAWDWVLFERGADQALRAQWLAQWQQGLSPGEAAPPAMLWAMQEALELTYQRETEAALARAASASAEPTAPRCRPRLQAAFCIDVRSERMRRALEAGDPDIQTIGFAGFFGLPMAFTPLGTTHAQPHLPAALIQPTLQASEAAATPDEQALLTRHRQQALTQARAEQDFKQGALSGFSFVETLGWAAAWKLLRDTLHLADAPRHDGLTERDYRRLRPVAPALTDHDAVALAHKALSGMALTRDFAPIVMFVGHTARSANNPQVASLRCGACCGQSGEVNARLLADLLNRPAVRRGLSPLGIDIPADTHFVAALHNTTTDELTLTDAPAGLAIDQLEAWLTRATRDAQAQAQHPGLPDLPGAKPRNPARALIRRSHDWAQTRPEWGLANNAALIIAPRARTRSLNLQGRVFLHDHDATQDPDGALLTGILSGPLMVAHAINMHYNAAVLDHPRWGSGNKLLHNVVGGHIGVFEGNGGDLRTGLSLQSVHDGSDWVHTPQRLTVWIDAPQAHIEQAVRRLPGLQQLVQGRWLHLRAMPPATVPSRHQACA